MSVDFNRVVGSTGLIGPAGEAGPMGITGETGPMGPGTPLVKGTISTDGYATKNDIRKNRFGYFVECGQANNEVDYTSFYLKGMSQTDLYYGTLASGKKISAYYSSMSSGALYVVYFVHEQTTPSTIKLNLISSYDDESIGATSFLVMINGQQTSATNPLLWTAGSVLAFAGCQSRMFFVGYLGNVLTSSKNTQSLPFYHYATAPAEADLPVRPCFYHVASDNGWYYCDGLA